MNFLNFSESQLGRTKKGGFLKTFTGFTAIVDKFNSLLEVHVIAFSVFFFFFSDQGCCSEWEAWWVDVIAGHYKEAFC